jgi:hypothetical protein
MDLKLKRTERTVAYVLMVKRNLSLITLTVQDVPTELQPMLTVPIVYFAKMKLLKPNPTDLIAQYVVETRKKNLIVDATSVLMVLKYPILVLVPNVWMVKKQMLIDPTVLNVQMVKLKLMLNN